MSTITPWWTTPLRLTSLCCSQILEFLHLLLLAMNLLNSIYDKPYLQRKAWLWITQLRIDDSMMVSDQVLASSKTVTCKVEVLPVT